MHIRFGKPQLVAALVLGMAAAACGGSSGSTSSKPPPPTPKPVVKTATVTVGGKSETILTDAKSGLTLYYYTPDKGGKVTCAGQCLVAWPPELLPTGESKPGVSGKVSGTLGTVSSPSGTMVTYNGWPLYTFQRDKAAGDVTGQNVGGKWFVAALDIPSATAG